jgi:hypothetical protein
VLLEVDVFPAQAEDFRLAQAECEGDGDDGFQAVAADGVQEAANLV